MQKDIIIYKTEDGQTSLEVSLKKDTVWLTLNQISELFQRDKSVISRHIGNIYKTDELKKSSTVANYATVQIEGNRKITRKLEYFNLDMIISVGYRVNSKRGTQFRIWATKVLKDHIVKLCDAVIIIPKIHDCFQPFIDLFFYYHLAFHFGRARGGIDDDFPRNRAKSVTTSRSVLPPQFSPRSELFNIQHRTGLAFKDSGYA